MLEVEYKYPVTDISRVKSVLAQMDAKVSRTLESNIMYDNGGFLKRKDARLRVRTGNRNLLTYKKPIKSKDGAKREIEHEIVFTGDVVPILENSGFKQATSYERYRSKYRYGGVEVVLDEYPFATFIELEGRLQDIKDVSLFFKGAIGEPTDKPCDTLYQEWRKEKGLPFKAHMNFDDYDK